MYNKITLFLILFIWLFLGSSTWVYGWTSEVGTLDTIHYIPPIYAKDGLGVPSSVEDNFLILSTPESTPFDVVIQNSQWINWVGANQISETLTISKSSPWVISLSQTPYGTSGFGSLGIVGDGQLNTPDTENGLIVTSSDTSKRFYANIRHSSWSQWTSITAKWQTALWQNFRSGHLHTNANELSQKSHFISVMAVEDNTTINFSDVSPGITFVWWLTNPWPIILDRYESYVVWVRLDQFSNFSVVNDLNGTLVTSNKPIIMNSGSFLAGAQWAWRDIGSDQIVPVDHLWSQFIVIEWSGWSNASVLETPIIVSHYDGTEIFLRGSSTPIDLWWWDTTLDAGEYYIISGNEYPASGSMFIRTSHPAYVYQSTSSNSNNGNGMNFVAAIRPDLEPQSVLIADADQLGTPIIYAVAPTNATVTVDGSDLSWGANIPGTANFILYTITGKTANVDISSTAGYFVSMTSVSGNRWAAGFFVGFPNSYALRDLVTTLPASSTDIDVLWNDVQWNNTFIVSDIPTPPSNGTAIILSNGNIRYTPNPDFTGTDTFEYEISNGLGITDVTDVQVSIDSDGDGVGNTFDLDDDNDGIPDSIELLHGDTDNDGIANVFDLDSDNDGIYDLQEAGHDGIDDDNNGVLDAFAGSNGLVDQVETVGESGILNYTLWNQDSDTLENYRDLDSDGDGIPDNVEAQDISSYIIPSYDYTLSWLDISYSGGLTPVNSDIDTFPDFLDLDSDNQGEDDTVESGLVISGDTWNNGLIASSESIDDYTDVNGILDDLTTLPDTDSDGIPDFRDDTIDNLAPTDITFSGSLSENSPSGTEVGVFSTIDPDLDDTHTYSLVTGTGDTDNDFFVFSGSTLVTQWVLDFETQSTYSILVESNDGKGWIYQEVFIIDVEDIDEVAPVFSDITLESNNLNPLYATVGDEIQFSLWLVDSDTWNLGNTLDFQIGTWSILTSPVFLPVADPIDTGSVVATVLSWQNGPISITSINFSDQEWNLLTGAVIPYTPNPAIIIDTISPEIVFNQWVDVGPVQSDTVNISVADLNRDITSYQYWFSSDTTCDASDVFESTFLDSWDISFNTEDNNGNYICVRATDLAGNTRYRISDFPLNIDITSPSLPEIFSPTHQSVLSDTTPTILGTAEPNATISLVIDGNTYTTTAGNSGNWTIEISTALVEWDYTIEVSQTDIAGNTSSLLSRNISIDTTAPTLLEVTPIPSPTNNTTPVYVFSTDEEWEIIYGWSCSSSTFLGDAGEISINFSALDDGVYGDCTITIIDIAGNSSPALDVSNFIIDTQIPFITLLGETPLEIELWSSYIDAWAIASDNIDGDITTRINLDNPIDSLALWSYTITYDVVDSAGNSATQVSRVVNVIDTESPVFWVQDDIGEGPTQSDIFNISVVDFDLDDTTLMYWFSSDNICDSSDIFLFPFISDEDIVFNTQEANGQYLCFVAKDDSENVSYQISEFPLYIDITPPIVLSAPDLVPQSDSGLDTTDNLTNQLRPQFTGICNDGDRVTLFIDGIADSNSICLGWEYNLSPTNELSDGDRQIQVVFTDIAGNVSDFWPILTLSVDTSLPLSVTAVDVVSQSDSWDDNTDNITQNTTPTLTWFWEPGSQVGITIDTVVYTGSVNDLGEWDVRIDIPLLDNLYIVDVSIIDAAGNIGESVEFEFTIDTVNQLPIITTPIHQDNIINIQESNAVLILGTAEPSSTVGVSIDDGENPPVFTLAQTDTEWNWNLQDNQLDVSGLNEGTLFLRAVSEDIAGNISPTTSIAIEYDSTVPQLASPISVTTDISSANISWETNESASSEIIYGLSVGIDTTTWEQNIVPRVTNHSLTLWELQSCTIYFYNIISKDEAGNEFIDGIHSFVTTWCPGWAAIEDQNTTNIIPTGSGATWNNILSLSSGVDLLEVDVPEGYFDTGSGTCSGDGVFFQFKQLEEMPVVSSFWTPELNPITLKTYDLSAYCNVDERIEEFDEEITVTMSYAQSEVNIFNEEQIKIYRYDTDTSDWQSLTDCSNDLAANRVSCTTDHFSTFWVFTSASSDSGWRGGWLSPLACRDPDALNYERFGRADNSLCEYENEEELVFSAASENKDICPLGDNSGNTDDWLCEPQVNTDKDDDTYISSEIVASDLQVNDSKEQVDDPISQIDKESQNLNTDDFQDKKYTVKNTFDSCPITRDIQDAFYEYRKIWVFTDQDLSIYGDQILKFADIGIVDGYKDGTFRPQADITRAEFLKIALISHCYEYRNENPNDLLYTDVDLSSWQAKVIQKAQELGMINGDSTEEGIPIFRPDDIITKAEAVKILMNISEIQSQQLQELEYEDISVDWHRGYIQNGQSLGLFDPLEDNNQFYPESWVQRENMVHLIYNLVELYK